MCDLCPPLPRMLVRVVMFALLVSASFGCKNECSNEPPNVTASPPQKLCTLLECAEQYDWVQGTENDPEADLIIRYDAKFRSGSIDPYANVRIWVGALGEKYTAEEVADEITARYQKNSPGFKLVSKTSTTLGGLPASRIDYTGYQSQTGDAVQGYQIFSVIETCGRITLVSADYSSRKSVYDYFLADANSVVESLTVM
jgi:hypothetical protein